MKRILLTIFVAACLLNVNVMNAQQQIKDRNEKFTNPLIYSDVPDMSVCRVDDEYYMISTTMHLMPGAPVMKSKDMINWEIVSYVFDKLTDTPNYNLKDGTAYGRGQWASSIRYHNGSFYVYFSPNDQPWKGYVYTTKDPSDKWTLVSRTPHFHDASLLFDDDGKVYIFSGTGSLCQLKDDLSDIEPGGVNMKIFERDSDETGLLEGSQAIKYKGRYYLLMISWPSGKIRRQVCYRADKITGPYEKKVILEHNFDTYGGVAQGCLVDTPQDKWYGMIFQDRGAVGRVPILMPCTWKDGWPMLGNENGEVPLVMNKPLKESGVSTALTVSDDFKSDNLKINWQWNHNPIDEAWSLKERPGFLRLKTSRVVENIYAAPNSLTQRMGGPKCSGTVMMDVSHMKDGDVAGISAFNGHSGTLAVIVENDKKYLTMTFSVVNLDDKDKSITSVDSAEKARVELRENIISLRIDADFSAHRDIATFYYSTDNENWIPIGKKFKMQFDYTRMFMGSKFALFNYATQNKGGFVDFDFFNYKTISDDI